MSKKYHKKHIPDNSITIILNFSSPEQLKQFLNNEEYQKIYGKLDTFAMQKGAKVEHFTNP